MWAGVSLHGEANRILHQGLKGAEVHSVFHKAINLIDQDGCIISLLTKAIDEAPMSILIDILDFDRWGIVAGEKVEASPSKITLGSHIIDLSKAKVYELSRGCFLAGSLMIRKNLETLRQLLTSNHPPLHHSFDKMASQMLAERTAALKEACLQHTSSRIIQAGRSLLGLGQGLTPSGDDILMGMFLVLGLEGSPMGDFDQLLGEIIAGVGDQTTDVSYQGLLRASRGQYRSILVKAAQAMSDAAEIDDILAEVLTIGHTSGWDLLSGIVVGCEILLEKENRNVN